MLVIPKEPLESIAAIDESQEALAGHLLNVCRQVAAAEGLQAAGYRVVANTGVDAGQTVPHLHFHVLGGRDLRWPPG